MRRCKAMAAAKALEEEKTHGVIIGVGIAILLILTITAVILGATGYTPSEKIRPIAQFYLYYAMNIFKKELWAATPEAVNAMVWDYRGYDTLFETSVFFLAVIGAVAVLRLPGIKDVTTKGIFAGKGLSLIVKVVTKFIVAFILIVAISIAIHGNLTPGGGFQAGAAVSIATLVVLAAFSRAFLEERHVTTKLMLPIRVIGVAGIGLVALAPALIAIAGIFAFAMQNQPKVWAPNFGFPPGFGDFWLSGNQFYYNFLEFLAVGAGFTVIYLMYSIPELIYKEVLEKK